MPSLHLAGVRVQMDKAVADNDRMGKLVSSDSTGNDPVRFNDFWGRWTQTGDHGDATKETAEKCELIFEAAVEGLVELVDELRAWPIEQRSDINNYQDLRESSRLAYWNSMPAYPTTRLVSPVVSAVVA